MARNVSAMVAAKAASAKAQAPQQQEGLQKLIVAVGAQNGRTIQAGLVGPDAEEMLPSGISVATLGYIQEFGLGVPERAYTRITEARESGNWMKRIIQITSEEMHQVAASKESPKKAEDTAAKVAWNKYLALGSKMADDLRSTILSGVAPANAASTIKEKGSNTPLIDTGKMLHAHAAIIDFKGKTEVVK